MKRTNLSQWKGQLYEETDGVATGSLLCPLLANASVCSIEERLEQEGKMPTYYRRFVDDTLTVMGQKTNKQKICGESS